MRLKMIVLACFLSSALVPSTSARPVRKPMTQRPAQPDRPTITYYDPSTLLQKIGLLKIAGVSWGQREAVALAELEEAGFTIRHDKDDHKSFDELVDTFISEGERDPLYMLKTNSYAIYASKPNEQITVTMWAVPEGWRVAYVSYEYKGGIAPSELERVAVEKYKGLGFRIDGSSGWNFVCILSAKTWSELPSIKIDPYFGHFELELSGGTSGEETLTQPFKEAVAKRKGLSQPSF